MGFQEFIKSQKKKAILFFLAGFFSGGLLFYLCRQPMGEALSQMEENLIFWASVEQSVWETLFILIWDRGKTLGILWLAGFTGIRKIYIGACIVCSGIQSGFLLFYFLLFRGARGVFFWGASSVLHLLFLCPLYLYSFYHICEKKREKRVPVLLVTLVLFVLSCVLETKVGVPLIQWMYRT